MMRPSLLASDTTLVGYDELHGDAADDTDQVPHLERKLCNVCAYLISFSSGNANSFVSNGSGGQELEA